MNLQRIALAAALSISALSVPALCVSAPAKSPDAQSRLEGLRERIERLRSSLAESEGDRDEAREELRASERAISDANRELRDLGRRRAASVASLRELALRKNELQSTVDSREQALSRLLAGFYMAGDPGYVRLLLSGQDPNQTSRELRYVAYLSRAYAGLVESLRAELARLRDVEAGELEASAQIAEIEKAQRAGREKLFKQRSERRRTLARVSDRLRAQSREVKSLERDEARLSRLVEEIARMVSAPGSALRNEGIPPPDAGNFADLKGRLRLPVRGVLSHRFGAARSGGGPSWKGLFIQSSAGQEVRAVAPGLVVFAEWMRGYGNLLILDHGNAYLTIYGNNETLLKQVGDRVGSAEPIAIVGASGGGQETGLYFEARHDGKAFDPLKWAKLR